MKVILAALLFTLGLSGCAIVPVPVYGYGQYGGGVVVVSPQRGYGGGYGHHGWGGRR